MRVFFDTEFIEDGKTIDLISIGLVREDGQELYLVSSEFDESKASLWVRENVLAHIPADVKRHQRREIADIILSFLWDVEKPEFWAYYADYDWVALCQLYGKMIDLPKGWPMYCRDLKQLADDLKIELPQPKGVEHHALADARWVAESFDLCQEQRKGVIR
jgi:hypothetical protein